MAKTLVIVESPAKAKTVNHYLGEDYVVKASMGHVRDLPKKKMGVDVEKDFEPTYEVILEKKKTVAELKKAAKESERVILAADPDREGEAISWHLSQLLADANPNIFRAAFNEITEEGVQAAFQNLGQIDLNLFEAQQIAPRPRPARRLQDQPPPVEEDRPGPGRGPGPVRGPPPHRRPGEGDRGLRPRGILADHGPARSPEPAGLQGRPGQGRRQESQGP